TRYRRSPRLRPRWSGCGSGARALPRGCRSGGRPLLALDLGAVHDPPALRIERVAPVHGAAIVPQHETADTPDMLPGEFRPIDEAPQFVEQRLGVREGK